MRTDVPQPAALTSAWFITRAAWRNGPLAFCLSLLEPLANVLGAMSPLFVGMVVAGAIEHDASRLASCSMAPATTIPTNSGLIAPSTLASGSSRLRQKASGPLRHAARVMNQAEVRAAGWGTSVRIGGLLGSGGPTGEPAGLQGEHLGVLLSLIHI